jgi:5-methylcytosine-specific restriction endonuclease McrBC regulatory subunit McrC
MHDVLINYLCIYDPYDKQLFLPYTPVASTGVPIPHKCFANFFRPTCIDAFQYNNNCIKLNMEINFFLKIN